MTKPLYPNDLPALDERGLAAITRFLLEKQSPHRTSPRVKARVCALAVEMRRAGRPFPQRRPAAEHLQVSVGGYDTAISTLVAQGLLAWRIELVPGAIAKRENLMQERYLDPDQRLVDAYVASRQSFTPRSAVNAVRYARSAAA